MVDSIYAGHSFIDPFPLFALSILLMLFDAQYISCDSIFIWLLFAFIEIGLQIQFHNESCRDWARRCVSVRSRGGMFTASAL